MSQNKITKMSSLGLFTFLRTYSRRLDPNDVNSYVESWEQCLTRVINACNTQLKVGFTKEEEKELFDILYNLKCSVAGRFLWQLGTETVDRLGIPSLQNCAFVVINSVDSICYIMSMLMVGAGVGFRILPSDVENFPIVKYTVNTRVDSKDADWITPDSREGWVKLLGKVLKSHFYSGKSFTYSCMLLRSKGAPIRFGGVSSGAPILQEGLQKIDEILNKCAGKKLQSIDILDICTVIGKIVVSGNVRRSALIALGDAKDTEYLNAKRWDLGNIPNHRAYSNNSVICDDIKDILNNEDFWNGYQGNGEPYGLVNLNLSRKCGRLNDFRYPDPNIEGYNPCCEQSLENKESCCLAELYLPNIKTKEELYTCAKYLYRICKHSLTLPCKISEETEKIVHKNMRMGIGITGYLQATEEQKQWLPDCYEFLRKFDEEYSALHGFPKSIKLTTCKPSGTLSILAGVTPGVHPGYARYYIRRIRIASESKLIQIARDHGYPVEYSRNFDGTDDHTTQIISFPFKLSDETVIAENCTAIQQLEYVKRLQTDWSDNAVSVTVYYRKHEIPEIKEWLAKNYNDCVKTVSFLLHSDHGFQQAPYEQITKERYEEMISQCRPITSVEGICYREEKEEDLAQNECPGGACPLR